MALTTTDNKIVYTCSSGITQYHFGFPVLQDTDLQVWYYDNNNNETLLQLNTDYIIILNNDNTGYVTLNTAYNNGKLLLYREVPYTQETVYPENSPFPAKSHEKALDKLTMESQQLQEQIERTLKSDIVTDTIDVKGKRIVNIGDPMDDEDACNYRTVLETVSGLVNNNTQVNNNTYTLESLSDTNIINANNNQILIYDNGEWVNSDLETVSGLVNNNGSSTFLDSPDTPDTYSDNANKVLRVNSAEDGIEFIDLSINGDMLKSVYDENNNGIVDKAEAIDDGSNIITATNIKDAVDKKHNRQHTINSTEDHTSTITSGKLIKADNNGLPTEATNTDEEVANTVNLAHSPYIWGTHEIDETNLYDGKIIQYSESAGKWVIAGLPDVSSNVSSFLDSPDTPDTYSDNANKVLRVNSTEDSIEFVDFESLIDTEDVIDVKGKRIVNVGDPMGYEDACNYETVYSMILSLVNSGTFLDSPDTPDTYSDNANKVLRVNSTEDSIEFVDFESLIDTDALLNAGRTVNTISDLINITDLQENNVINVLGFHEKDDGGGGVFYYDPSRDKSEHNGGTIIDPDISFPTDWTNTTQQQNWLNGDNTGNGCWVRIIDKDLYAKWFGLKNNTDFDQSLIIQKVVDMAQEQDLRIMLPYKEKFRLDNEITLKQGKNDSGDTKNYSIYIEGNSCTIYQNNNNNCFSIIPRCTYADQNTGRNAGNIIIKNINFDGYFINTNNYTNARALNIGADGYSISPFEYGLIQNILITNYLRPPIYITSSRHFIFDNVVSRNGGIEIQQLSNGFSGDIIFTNCEFNGNESIRPLYLYGKTTSGEAQIRGLHFKDCVFYGTGTRIEAQDNSKLHDIWFENCAWDMPGSPSGEIGIYVFAARSGTIFQLYFDEPYIVNAPGISFYAQSDDPSYIKALRFNGGRVSLSTDDAIKFVNVEGASISNCDFSENSKDDINIAEGNNSITVQNCVSYSNENPAGHWLSFGGEGTNNIVISDNTYILDLNDWTDSSAIKLITGNVKINDTVNDKETDNAGSSGSSSTNFVDLTTDQTIDGIKTFANPIKIPDASEADEAMTYGQFINAGSSADCSDCVKSTDFDCAKGTYGYTKLPNGIILQWGIVIQGNGGNPYTVSLPITFPHHAFSVNLTSFNTDRNYRVVQDNPDNITSSFSVTTSSYSTNVDNDYYFYWFAVGY